MLAADTARHLLVVVDETCTSPSLCANVRAHGGRGRLEVFVVSPTHGTAATEWYADEDAARADATRRLRAWIGCLREQGIETCGALAGPDPVQGIADALRRFPADQLLIITAPQRPSSWLPPSVVDRARRAFTQPIEHVVMPTTADRRIEVNVLVTAASQQGATRGIAEAIVRTLRGRGFDVTVEGPDEVRDVAAYDAFVVGSALYVGHWLEAATAFVERFAPELSTRPVWLFSSGPVGDPSRKLVQKMTSDPVELPRLLELTGAREHRIFAGKLVGKELPRPQRLSLMAFRGVEGDWRDWRAIEDWAGGIADSLAREPVDEVALA